MNRRNFLRTHAAALVAGVAGVQAQERSEARIRAGQIGTTHAHAAGKMAAMRKLDRLYEVVGVVEPDDDRWEKIKEDDVYSGVPRLTMEQLLGSPGLQAVAVETDIDDLVPTALSCVQAGMHVHLDKPAGVALEDLKALHRAAAAGRRAIQMGYMLRFNPGIQFCRQAIDAGWLGDVFEVHAVMSKTIGGESRGPLARYPGGAMFELGCHLIDSIVGMLGKPEKVTPFLRRSREADGDSLADNCLAVLEYPNATATVRTALMEVQGQERRQFTVCGDGGTVDIRPLEPPRLRLALSEARGKFHRGYQDFDLPKAPGRYDDEFVELAAIIRGEKEPQFSLAHDLDVHETILRASGMVL
ncbi:MAG: Gfo/Idh/MocA family oxidoreductase [Verrucomicrobiales bacterium]